jgi:hypothetical protein
MAHKQRTALTELAIKNAGPKLNQAGQPRDTRYSDGRNLFLLVRGGGAKTWEFRYSKDKLKRVMILGDYPQMTLKQARHRSGELRDLLYRGLDPVQEKRKARDQQRKQVEELRTQRQQRREQRITQAKAKQQQRRKQDPPKTPTPARGFYQLRDLVPHKIFPGTRSTLYVWMEKGLFPGPIKLPSGYNAWPRAEVDEWEANLLKIPRKEKTGVGWIDELYPTLKRAQGGHHNGA